MGLLDGIGDYYWRDWAKRLPLRTGGQPFETYLADLSRTLDDAPLSINTLTTTDRLLLLELVGFHRDAVAYELARVARDARDTTLPGVAGGIIAAIYAASAPVIALAQAVLALVNGRQERRQRRLETQADRLTATIDRLRKDLLR